MAHVPRQNLTARNWVGREAYDICIHHIHPYPPIYALVLYVEHVTGMCVQTCVRVSN